MSNTSNMLVGLLGVAAIGGAVVQGNRPPTDVNVVNTPNVNVANTPTVNVGNVPTVKVQESGAPVYFSFTGQSGALHYETPTPDQYTVPEGKRLHITHASAIGSTGQGIEFSYLGIGVRTGVFDTRVTHFLDVPRPSIVNSDARVNMSTSEVLDMWAESGDTVKIFVGRTSGFQGSPPAYFTFHISGYLVDAS
jgi:hypothetical protein